MQIQNDATLDNSCDTNADPSSGSDRRQKNRASCHGFAEVIVFETGFLFRGEIQDLSETGCLVATKARLKVESSHKVELRFTLKNVGFHLYARVANVREGLGVGLQFAPVNEDLGAKLHALCLELNNGPARDDPFQ